MQCIPPLSFWSAVGFFPPLSWRRFRLISNFRTSPSWLQYVWSGTSPSAVVARFCIPADIARALERFVEVKRLLRRLCGDIFLKTFFPLFEFPLKCIFGKKTSWILKNCKYWESSEELIYDNPASLYVSSHLKLGRKGNFHLFLLCPVPNCCTDTLHTFPVGLRQLDYFNSHNFWLSNAKEVLLFWKHLDSSELDLLQCSWVKAERVSDGRRKAQQLREIFLSGGNFKSLFCLSNSQTVLLQTGNETLLILRTWMCSQRTFCSVAHIYRKCFISVNDSLEALTLQHRSVLFFAIIQINIYVCVGNTWWLEIHIHWW